LALITAPVDTFHVSPISLGIIQHNRQRKAGRGFSCDRRHDVIRRGSVSEGDTGIGDDLTKEGLNVRLYEVRDYFQQRPEEGMTQADICLSLLRTRLSKLRLNRCFVAPSTITGAGNGVFASRDISQGELITLYPGDAVLIQDSTAEDSSAAPMGVMFGSHVKEGGRSTDRVTSQEARSYEMEINKYTSIVAEPLIGAEDSAYLSHFANDGASLYEFDSTSREIYSKATAARCNAAHMVMEGAHLTTVATIAINKGDEVFVSYGQGYWLSRSHSESDTDEKAGVVFEMDAAVPRGTGADVILGDYNGSVGSAESPWENRKTRRSKKKNAPKDKKRGFGT
jgi:hypothetical protein